MDHLVTAENTKFDKYKEMLNTLSKQTELMDNYVAIVKKEERSTRLKFGLKMLLFLALQFMYAHYTISNGLLWWDKPNLYLMALMGFIVLFKLGCSPAKKYKQQLERISSLKIEIDALSKQASDYVENNQKPTLM